jgi:SPP1 gp7 family putative phage head morphogenesis protein
MSCTLVAHQSTGIVVYHARMPINLPAIAARLRANANAMHRGAGGRLMRGHPFRRVLPRQTAATAIAAEYAGRIRSVTTGVIRVAIRPLLEQLPRLVAGHAAEVGHTIRADRGEIREVEMLVTHAERAVRDRLGPVLLNEMARRAVDQAGRRQAQQLGAQLKALVGVDIPARAKAEAAIVDRFALQNAQLITDVGETAMRQVARVVTHGLATGKRHEDIADDIRDRLDIADSRADFIARDQVAKLNGSLNKARQLELGVTSYVWRHGGSEDPRPDHVARDGQPFEWGELDSEPSVEPNCSCTAEPLVDVSFVGDRGDDDDDDA